MYEYLDYKKIKKNLDELSTQYHSAQPFKHIVFQDLIHPEKLEELAKSFPGEQWPYWHSYHGDHAQQTKVCESTTKMPLGVCQVLWELSSGPFLKLLQIITGINNLLPDPHFRGAGMHMTLPGGTLTPHIDHHLYPEHPRYRQLNLIVYLTKDWAPENQGYFELWDRNCKKIEKEVSPSFGNSLLFRTSDHSMHGFSKPVRDRYRRSLSMFYYTATEFDLDHYGGNTATFWQPQTIKPEGVGDFLRLPLQRALWTSARALGKLSWNCQRGAMILGKQKF